MLEFLFLGYFLHRELIGKSSPIFMKSVTSSYSFPSKHHKEGKKLKKNSTIIFYSEEKFFGKWKIIMNRQHYTLILTNYAIRFVQNCRSPAIILPVFAFSIISELSPTQLNVTTKLTYSFIITFLDSYVDFIPSIKEAQNNHLKFTNGINQYISSEPDHFLKANCKNSKAMCYLFHNYHARYSKKDHTKKYSWFCRTYPPRDIIPGNKITIQFFRKSNEARNRNRYPIICYTTPNGGVLLRASQPSTQFDISKLSIYAESEYLQKVYPNKVFDIYDLRPLTAAFGTLFKGGGFEDPILYNKNSKIRFCGIENIFYVTKNYLDIKKLFDLTINDHCLKYVIAKQRKSTYNLLLSQSNWTKQLYVILTTSKNIVKSLLKGNIAIIHCTDGWDRTSQAALLPQIILNPASRTLDGFLTIFIREFSKRGHNLGLRNGYQTEINSFWNATLQSSRSPIVVQLLEIVYQLMEKNPTAFEFNSDFINFLMWHMYSQEFSEFMGDDYMIRSKKFNIGYPKIMNFIHDEVELMQKYRNIHYEKQNKTLKIPNIDEYVELKTIHRCIFPAACTGHLY
ncbi:hypothetical protein TRFO_31907 [Tritrichomonas foetus]|uniref:Myotubularin phosphatase domain-containing protein n=1 Tax=Tritrichomonas foetus TaxID=1144522 RepID=A0A1J4JR99_9EUKA|nr:hypothetical protein TRFO_31907 [Tritrichomonas foetus]|eukprot:OHT01282.1 hypothetical protein TRFO_31907 [Tritrichomonas foetus]